MSRVAAVVFLTVVIGLRASAQTIFDSSAGEITMGGPSTRSQAPASPEYPLGQPHARAKVLGFLVRSDGETLSVELPDQRVVRFQLESRTRYFPEFTPESLASFHMTDYVQVESEVDDKGSLVAHSVRFIRKASPGEQAEIFQSPELLIRWRANVLASRSPDPAADDRKLSLVGKPEAIAERPAELPGAQSRQAIKASGAAEEEVIALVRQSVNDAFERLPNFRAKQVTSMFGSTAKPVKWIPDGVVTAEIAYEDDRESYGDIRVNGRRPASAPPTADDDYMRSLNKAWSTGDFKTLSHCVLSELADSDFRKAHSEQSNGETLVVYEFSGRRSSGCIGVNYKSQIMYPAYKGLMKVREQTGEVIHVEVAAADIPEAFPLDRAERSVDFETVRIGAERYLLPATAYWFGCFRNSYSCFLNRIDFRDYRRFEADSKVLFDK